MIAQKRKGGGMSVKAYMDKMDRGRLPKEPSERVLEILRRNGGPMTLGVMLNRCRSIRRAAVAGAIDALAADGAIHAEELQDSIGRPFMRLSLAKKGSE